MKILKIRAQKSLLPRVYDKRKSVHNYPWTLWGEKVSSKPSSLFSPSAVHCCLPTPLKEPLGMYCTKYVSNTVDQVIPFRYDTLKVQLSKIRKNLSQCCGLSKCWFSYQCYLTLTILFRLTAAWTAHSKFPTWKTPKSSARLNRSQNHGIIKVE